MPEFFSSKTGVPWVTITDMADQTSVVETKERVSKEAFREIFRNRLVRKGTLLMSIKLTVGRTAFMGIDGVHNEAIVSITPDERIVLSEFLFYLLPLIDYRQYQDRAVKGQTINLGKLREMELTLPPVEEQRRIVKILDSLRRLSTIEQTIADDRRRLHDEVVYRMTRGELLTGADG
jgi:type I restriction enzyme S subunit